MKFDLQLYRGYANEHQVIFYGHVFKTLLPDAAYTAEKRKLKYARAILKMFTIKTLNNVKITLFFKDKKVETYTLSDGYFRICIPFEGLQSGWHSYYVEAEYMGGRCKKKEEILKPYPGKIAFISDIDDTFLISHSNNVLKKLYILLTKNVHKRKIFSDVALHYKLLSESGKTDKVSANTFFYVSSSEWNLYQFIIEFTQLNNLPKAVLKLKKIKMGLTDFLFTGGGKHDHKFNKIKDILEFYPEMNFVLLGDDTQKDAFIYESIAKYFPLKVKAIYIRQTRRHPKKKIYQTLKNTEKLSVNTCYFHTSHEAIQHSKRIGLI